MTQLNNLHKDVGTNHVVEPDVPADGVVGVLLPAGPHVPQPGLVVEDAQAVDEHDGVEDEPPAALAELGEGGGHGGPPPVSEPSLNLEQENMKYFHPKPAQLTCISESPALEDRRIASPLSSFCFDLNCCSR